MCLFTLGDYVMLVSKLCQRFTIKTAEVHKEMLIFFVAVEIQTIRTYQTKGTGNLFKTEVSNIQQFS